MRMDILTGFLLGDGCVLYPAKTSKTPRFEMKRMAPSEDYIHWMIDNLGLEFTGITKFSAPYKKGGQDYERIKVHSRCTASLVPIHAQCYKDRKRIMPRKLIEQHFNEVSLAVWYMDDGSCNSVESSVRTRYHIMISTQAYGYEDLDWLSDFIYTKYGIRFRVDSYNRMRLSIQDEVEHFFKLVRPTIDQIPSMAYKVH